MPAVMKSYHRVPPMQKLHESLPHRPIRAPPDPPPHPHTHTSHAPVCCEPTPTSLTVLLYVRRNHKAYQGRNRHLPKLPAFKPKVESQSRHSFTCFPYCHGVYLSNFCLPGSLNFTPPHSLSISLQHKVTRVMRSAYY